MADGRGFGLFTLGAVVALCIAACAAGSGGQGVAISPETQTQLRAAAVARALQGLPDARRCEAVAISSSALDDAASAADLAAELARGIGELTPSERRLISALAAEVQASLAEQAPEQVEAALSDWRRAVQIAASDFALECGR